MTEYQAVNRVRHVVLRALHSGDGTVLTMRCGLVADGRTDDLISGATSNCVACDDPPAPARLMNDRLLLREAKHVELRVRHLGTDLFFPNAAGLRDLAAQVTAFAEHLATKADELDRSAYL